MLNTARQWGELGEHVPDACANIVMNPRRPVARYLNREELERLGAALDRRREEHPWPVAALRLLTLTGARLSEVLNLRWDEIGALAEDGGSARLADTKTGPRTIWLEPEAARLVAALPRREDGRVFPEDLTPAQLYTFWVGAREEAGLHGMRIHDARHTWASQGVMNGVGLNRWGGCSDTGGAPPPPSTPISTTTPCGTPPRKPPPSSRGRWGTELGRRRCPTRRTKTPGNRIGRTAKQRGPRRPVRESLSGRQAGANGWTGRTRKVVRENPPDAGASTGWATTPLRHRPARPLRTPPNRPARPAGSGFERASSLVIAYASMFSSLRGHVPARGRARRLPPVRPNDRRRRRRAWCPLIRGRRPRQRRGGIRASGLHFGHSLSSFRSSFTNRLRYSDRGNGTA